MPAKVAHVSGLDSIRFVCALWVFFQHGGAPVFPNPFADGSYAHLAFRGFFANIWPGPPAVIIFFVISGFCIHFPFAASDKRPRLKEFYTRRFIRLLVPVLVAVPLSGLLGVQMALFQESVLWSVLAELIYYIFYPVLRAAHLRFGSWHGIVLVSFAAATVVAATNPSAGNYASYGSRLNWLLGLPCWLLGCTLAESTRTGTPRVVSSRTIWAWRTAILGAACVCSILRYHTPLGYPWTLNFFAGAVVFWLKREIAHRAHIAPSRYLEWAGLWSYSIYLLHRFGFELFVRLFPSLHDSFFGWAFMDFFALSTCYVFYLLVERPSHSIARQVAQKLRPTTEPSLATDAA